MAQGKRFTEDQMEKALRKAGGIANHAAVIVQRATKKPCCGETVRNYIAHSEHLQKVQEELREDFVDVAESKLMHATKKGEPYAVRLVIETLGRKRGYVKRSELTGEDGGPIKYEDSAAEFRSKLARRLERQRAREISQESDD